MATASKYQWKGHSVTAARVDLVVSNSGSWQDAFQFGDPDDTTWNLLNQRFYLDVQLNPYDAVPLLSIHSVGGDITIADWTQRVIQINVPAEDIQASLNPGTYVYDLVMVDGSDTSIRVPLMYGSLTIVQGVTYPA